MSGKGPEMSEIQMRLMDAIKADISVNRKPDPRMVAAIFVSWDPQTGIVRVASAKTFDVEVQMVYLRVAELKKVLAKVLEVEATVAAARDEDWTRALGGELSPLFLE